MIVFYIALHICSMHACDEQLNDLHICYRSPDLHESCMHRRYSLVWHELAYIPINQITNAPEFYFLIMRAGRASCHEYFRRSASDFGPPDQNAQPELARPDRN